MTTGSPVARRTDMYNDLTFNYAQYWTGRDYEHQAEVAALRRLIGGRRYGRAIDVGGGYGRLSVVLTEFAKSVTLLDPSTQQLDLSTQIFPGHLFDRQQADAARLPFPDASIDLVIMVRVMHHLPDPVRELAEISRVLRPGGQAVIEVANSVHAARRIGAMLRFRRIPATPFDVRSEDSRQRGTAPFVNHHPRTVTGQFADVGLRVDRTLSVSNFRHALAKAVIPQRALLAVERAAQRPLSTFAFGPSMFFLLEKQGEADRPPAPDGHGPAGSAVRDHAGPGRHRLR